MCDRRRAIASWKRDVGPNMELNTRDAIQRMDEITWNRTVVLRCLGDRFGTERNRSPCGAITTSSSLPAPVSEEGFR